MVPGTWFPEALEQGRMQEREGGGMQELASPAIETQSGSELAETVLISVSLRCRHLPRGLFYCRC